MCREREGRKKRKGRKRTESVGEERDEKKREVKGMGQEERGGKGEPPYQSLFASGAAEDERRFRAQSAHHSRNLAQNSPARLV